jgi:hypothetical protein
MNTLAEIEAAADALPKREQRKLLERLAAKLSKPKPSKKAFVSAHDLMKDGCGIISSGVHDLGSNKKHMQGYGQ